MKTVVFTAWNRPEFLEPALDSWRRARGVEDWRFLFMVEPGGPPVVLELIEAFEVPFKVVWRNEERRGVLSNPWYGAEIAFGAGAPFVVFGEDDLIVSADVLEYMDWACRAYGGDLEILAVLAYDKTNQDGPANEVVRTSSFSPWIWGTWAGAWAGLLRDSWDHDYGTADHTGPGGWDWNIEKRVMPRWGLETVHPRASRSQHIGIYGVHMQPAQYHEQVAASFREDHGPLPAPWLEVPSHR